jgi:hypothetical protein
MNVKELEQSLQTSIGSQVEVIEEGIGRFPVITPFTMEDGDHFNIVLRGSESVREWYLTDEGDTLMHLSYWMDYDSLMKGNRRSIIDRVLGQFGIDNKDGELRLRVDYSDVGNATLSFLQALTRISDVTYLNREQVRATFLEDFRDFMKETVPEDRLTFDYNDKQYDKQKIYTVDAHINSRMVPLFVFAIGNNDRCRDVTINLHQYNSWQIQYQSIAIFQDQQDISRDVLARFSDVADKQFSSLTSSKVRIADYFRKILD